MCKSLKSLRLKKGWTLREMSENLKIDVSTYSKIENNKSELDTDRTQEIINKAINFIETHERVASKTVKELHDEVYNICLKKNYEVKDIPEKEKIKLKDKWLKKNKIKKLPPDPRLSSISSWSGWDIEVGFK